jgi:hypothetical protein
MQQFDIFLNPSFTASPITVSELELSDDYYVYTQSLGGGVTSEFNIRGYLNNSQNQIVIDNFIQYLNGNSNEAERKEIFYDDRKLSIVFNQFFQTTVAGGTPSPTVFIDDQLKNTINIIVSDNNFAWNGNEFARPSGAPASIGGASRINSTRDYLYEYTDENSYYLPIKLYKNYDKTTIETYKVCDDMIDVQVQPELAESYLGGIIDLNSEYFEMLENNSPNNPGESNVVSSILQCFVDTNLETNENVIFNNNAPSVSFVGGRGQYVEGAEYYVPITLSQPSLRGIEEVEIVVEYVTADPNDIIFADNYVIQWSEGEQIKYVNLTVNNDFVTEQTESIILKIIPVLNVYEGSPSNHVATINDNIIFKKVGFTGELGQMYQTLRGELMFTIVAQEGGLVRFELTLDQPSSLGGESVDVVFSYLTSAQNAAIQEVDFRLIHPQRVTWGAGELIKTVDVQLLVDQIPELLESVTVSLANPIGLTFDASVRPIQGAINIEDSTIITKPVVFNISDIYRQKGRMAEGNNATHLRYLSSEATNQESNVWLVKMGHQYNEATQGFDQSFSSFPDFNFGFDIDGNFASKIEMIITNNGDDIIFNGQTVSAGEDFIIPVTGNNFQFSLPTNAMLGETTVQLGEFTFNRPVYLRADYGMKIKYIHPTIPVSGIENGFHNFVMKGDGGGGGDTLSLGSFTIASTDDPFLDRYHLQTTYTNMAVTYEEGGVCTDTFLEETHKHNITINGIAILDDYNNDTNYSSFNFRLSTLLSIICPITSGFDGEAGSWQSIPYELFYPSSEDEADESSTGG